MAALRDSAGGAGRVPHEQALLALANAIVARDGADIGDVRKILVQAIGAAGYADACAVASAFQGFNRIADSVGTPIEPQQHGMLAPIRGDLGIDEFFRARK